MLTHGGRGGFTPSSLRSKRNLKGTYPQHIYKGCDDMTRETFESVSWAGSIYDRTMQQCPPPDEDDDDEENEGGASAPPISRDNNSII